MPFSNIKPSSKPADKTTKSSSTEKEASESKSSSLYMATKPLPSTWNLSVTTSNISTLISSPYCRPSTKEEPSKISNNLRIDSPSKSKIL